MVKQKLIKKIRRNLGFLTRAQTTILSAATIIALTSGVNAVLGVVKSRLLSYYFGTSSELTIFFTADKFPSLLYSLFVVGALSTVFIPIYSEALKEDEDDAHDVASVIITASTLLFVFLAALAFVFAKPLMVLFSAARFSPSELAQGILVLRLMLVAQIILLISSFLTGLLQSYNCFLIASFAPLFYNFGLISGIVFFSTPYGILGPAFGVIIGALAHLLIQLPGIKSVQYKYRFLLNFKNKYLKNFLQLIPPRLISVFVANGLNTVNNALAILIAKPAAIYLKFADQLQFFPINLFAISLSAAALPTLSRQASSNNRSRFKKIFLTSLHQMLFLVIPCSIILLVLRIPVIRLAYGTSRFSWEATVKTSYVLAFYSLSIFAQSTVYFLNRAFYALKDTKTPVKVSLITVLLNLGLSVFFIRSLNWGVWALAFSYSLTSLIDMLVLFYLLSRKLGGFTWEEVLKPFTKISYAALLMGTSIYIPLKILDNYVFDSTRTLQLLIITAVTSLFGVVAYVFFTKLLKVSEVELFLQSLKRLNFKKVLSRNPSVTDVRELD